MVVERPIIKLVYPKPIAIGATTVNSILADAIFEVAPVQRFTTATRISINKNMVKPKTIQLEYPIISLNQFPEDPLKSVISR